MIAEMIADGTLKDFSMMLLILVSLIVCWYIDESNHIKLCKKIKNALLEERKNDLLEEFKYNIGVIESNSDEALKDFEKLQHDDQKMFSDLYFDLVNINIRSGFLVNDLKEKSE